MKILVIYDSIFGNTEKIARAVVKSLGDGNDVMVVRTADVKNDQLIGLDFLAVGSPTRAFSPTPAMKDFLKQIPKGSLKGVKTIAFDTRIALRDVNSPVLSVFVKIFGYAAQPIANQLVKKGAELVFPPEGFYVKGSEGPLKDGELERAQEWGRRILLA